MFKDFINAAFLAAFLVPVAQAADETDLKRFSLTVNATPTLQNAAQSNVTGTDKISDTAYQYQLTYNHELISRDKGLFEQRLEFYAVRAFAHTYTLVNGLGRLEGNALLYGRRYLTASTGYQGMGLGWHAGIASVSDTRVQRCCGTTPTTDNNLIPLMAGEAFYRFNVTPNIFIEPNLTLTWRASGETVYYSTPALNIGGQF